MADSLVAGREAPLFVQQEMHRSELGDHAAGVQMSFGLGTLLVPVYVEPSRESNARSTSLLEDGSDVKPWQRRRRSRRRVVYIYNGGSINEGRLMVGPSIGRGGGGERQDEVSWYCAPTVESRVTLRCP